MSDPIIWITAANLLYLVSYSVRGILWLRILTVAAALLLVPYYALQPSPLITSIEWDAVFVLINLYWSVRLLVELRPVHLTPDEARLRLLSFSSLSIRDARNLFATGIWEDLSPGDSLVQHDIGTEHFSVILRGVASVMHSGTKIAELGEGQFVGYINTCAKQLDIDVIILKDTRIMCWPCRQLQSFLADRADVNLALERNVVLEVQRLLEMTLSQVKPTT